MEPIATNDTQLFCDVKLQFDQQLSNIHESDSHQYQHWPRPKVKCLHSLNLRANFGSYNWSGILTLQKFLLQHYNWTRHAGVITGAANPMIMYDTSPVLGSHGEVIIARMVTNLTLKGQKHE